jgi:2-dehydro-3-deoxygalactonokinase
MTVEKDLEPYFKKGVEEGLRGNLLQSIFTIRTNELFNLCTKRENYHYLSGLLIGTELREITNKKYTSVHIIAGSSLAALYSLALRVSGVLGVKSGDADAALISGQSIIFKKYLLHKNKPI